MGRPAALAVDVFFKAGASSAMIFPRLVLLALAASVAFADAALAQLSSSKKKAKVEPAPRTAVHAGPYVELGPLLGHVSSTSARIWLKASGPALLSVVVGKNDDLSDRVGFKAPKLEAASFFSTFVNATDL